MLETFKARLKAKTTAAGVNLSQVRIDAIADRLNKKSPDLKEEKDHDDKIDDLYTTEDLKEFAAVDDYQRAKSAKEKSDKEKADKEKADKEKSDKGKGDAEKTKTAEEKLADLEAKFGQLADTVKNFQEKESKAKLNETFQAKLAEKKIPLAFAKRFSIDKQEDMEALITEAENDYNEIMNKSTEEKVVNTDKPKGGKGSGSNAKPTEKELDAILEKI